MVICLERDADLHMAQLMPLPLTVSGFSKIQISFTFLVLAHLGSPRKKAVKRVYVYMCVPMAVTRSSSGSFVIRYVFPVLWMTSYLHVIGHMQGCRCNSGTASQPDGAARRLGRGLWLKPITLWYRLLQIGGEVCGLWLACLLVVAAMWPVATCTVAACCVMSSHKPMLHILCCWSTVREA